MKQYLVLTALYEDHSPHLSQLVNTITDMHCNIQDTRMSVLGSEAVIYMIVSGSWDSLAKLELALGQLEKQSGMLIQSKRTELSDEEEKCIPYQLHVVALDKVGILQKVLKLLNEYAIVATSLNIDSYAIGNQAIEMSALTMTIHIPLDLSLMQIRERFHQLCDDLNIDGVLEPLKS